jgi:hypothetical protein
MTMTVESFTKGNVFVFEMIILLTFISSTLLLIKFKQPFIDMLLKSVVSSLAEFITTCFDAAVSVLVVEGRSADA